MSIPDLYLGVPGRSGERVQWGAAAYSRLTLTLECISIYLSIQIDLSFCIDLSWNYPFFYIYIFQPLPPLSISSG